MSLFRDDNKTEKPTPRRRSKARTEGSVAKSGDLNGAVVLTSAALMLMWFGAGMFASLSRAMVVIFRHMGNTEITVESLPVYTWQGGKLLSAALMPLLLGVMSAGLIANIGQVGFKVTPKAAYPKWSRLSPMRGIERMFSPRSLVELAKSLLKLALVGGIIYVAILSQKERIYSLADVPVEAIGSEIAALMLKVLLVASLCLIVLGVMDYGYTRYEYEQSLKMTKEEVKEEARQSDGDPMVKGKIRGIMIKSALRRMMKKVPEADVVITNPIHLAVALKYDRQRHAAPVVVAKGARKVAERIKEIAAEYNIPIIENRPLAQSLFKSVDIGEEIPMTLYKAVAEVLAYVYRLKRKYFGVA